MKFLQNWIFFMVRHVAHIYIYTFTAKLLTDGLLIKFRQSAAGSRLTYNNRANTVFQLSFQGVDLPPPLLLLKCLVDTQTVDRGLVKAKMWRCQNHVHSPEISSGRGTTHILLCTFLTALITRLLESRQIERPNNRHTERAVRLTAPYVNDYHLTFHSFLRGTHYNHTF